MPLVSNGLLQKANAVFEYLQEVVKLGFRVNRNIKSHNDFTLYQDNLPDAPDISLFKTAGKDLIWLSVRSQNIPDPPKAPESISSFINYRGTNKEPVLNMPQGIMNYEYEKEHRELLKSKFEKYKAQWQEWWETNKEKILAHKLYEELFKVNRTIKYDERLELVWGYGFLLWKNNRYEIKYPLITQEMVIKHSGRDRAIYISPSEDAEPKLELDILTDIENFNPYDIHKQFTDYFQDETLCNFDAYPFPLKAFDPILKEIIGKLSPNGKFISTNSNINEIPLKDTPYIIDRWVLFIRKRQQDAILRDIANFKEKLKNENLASLGVLHSFIESKPKTNTVDSSDSELDNFDEWSIISNPQVLFPRPANREQSQVLNQFNRSDGVIIWGPPGTGKSHTIANLICHFIANGKRVLVTSQKEQALEVLHNMLPKPLRPFCVSVLTKSYDNKKKLEQAVTAIMEVRANSQSYRLRDKIKEIEQDLTNLGRKISDIEAKTKEYSTFHLRYIKFKNNKYLPSDIVKIIAKEEEKHNWLTDMPKYEICIKDDPNNPFASTVEVLGIFPLTNEEFLNLQKLHNLLSDYLNDLSYNLPSIQDIVDVSSFRKIVEDIERYESANCQIQKQGNIFIFKDKYSFENIKECLNALKEALENHKSIKEDWQYALLKKLQGKTFETSKFIQAVQSLCNSCTKLKHLYDAHDILIRIDLSKEFSLEEFHQCISQKLKQRDGKDSNFIECIKNTLSYFRHRKILESISINGKPLKSNKDFEIALNYINLAKEVRELLYKWNNFAININAPQILEDKTPLEHAKELLSLMEKLEAVYKYETIYMPNVKKTLQRVFKNANNILEEYTIEEIFNILKIKYTTFNFETSINMRERMLHKLHEVDSTKNPHPIVKKFIECLEKNPNNQNNDAIVNIWRECYVKLERLSELKASYEDYVKLLAKLSEQAPVWAEKWKRQDVPEEDLCPSFWKESWDFKALKRYILDISQKTKELHHLQEKQNRLIEEVKRKKEELILAKVHLFLLEGLTEEQAKALKRWHLAVRKLGKGKGKYALQRERQVRKEMSKAKNAVPVWIMSSYKVSEIIPSEFGIFDVVIIDEASQCDIRSLLVLARAKKAIVVGDPEQISPDAIGVNESDTQKLINTYLKEIPNKNYFDMRTSLYDLSNIAFSSKSVVMLREHFRCVPEIIEFCNKLCYNGKILPLRNVISKERLEPVLESVFVKDGVREERKNINKPEAEAICKKVKELVKRYKGKSIGIISLIGSDQAKYISNIIGDYISPEEQEECKLRVGDAYSFQGDERDIIILSMVVGAKDEKRITTMASDNRIYRQRFNVAVSRAKDKLILFHSVELNNLKPVDLRHKLLRYVKYKTLTDTEETGISDDVMETTFESKFEKDVFDWLTNRGYRVLSQVKVGHYRIDLVVEGENSRLGIECDGDRWHPPEKWWKDQIRQRQIERMGWTICRIWGSEFYQNKDKAMEHILYKLNELEIFPFKKVASKHI